MCICQMFSLRIRFNLYSALIQKQLIFLHGLISPHPLIGPTSTLSHPSQVIVYTCMTYKNVCMTDAKSSTPPINDPVLIRNY